MSDNLSHMVEAPEILLPALLIDSFEPWHPRRATSYTLVRVLFQQILDFFVRALPWRVSLVTRLFYMCRIENAPIQMGIGADVRRLTLSITLLATSRPSTLMTIGSYTPGSWTPLLSTQNAWYSAASRSG